MRAKNQARLIMEAVSVLHQRGFGHLKLFCYFKEGLGAWRHMLFASESFPDHIRDLPEPIASGSLPGWPVSQGKTPEEIADGIIAKHPRLAEAAFGGEDPYAIWYRNVLAMHAEGIIQMESSKVAKINGVLLIPRIFNNSSEAE